MTPPKGATMSTEQRAKIGASRRRETPAEKRCPTCEEALPASAFKVRRNGRTLRSQCIACEKAVRAAHARAAWRALTPEQREVRRVHNREFKLRQTYGIGIEDYDAMLADQGGCAICSSPEPGGRHGHFHVDHCHATGRVRALLCNGCNGALGFMRDDPARLRAAADYVEFHLSSTQKRKVTY